MPIRYTMHYQQRLLFDSPMVPIVTVAQVMAGLLAHVGRVVGREARAGGVQGAGAVWIAYRAARARRRWRAAAIYLAVLRAGSCRQWL